MLSCAQRLYLPAGSTSGIVGNVRVDLNILIDFTASEGWPPGQLIPVFPEFDTAIHVCNYLFAPQQRGFTKAHQPQPCASRLHLDLLRTPGSQATALLSTVLEQHQISELMKLRALQSCIRSSLFS